LSRECIVCMYFVCMYVCMYVGRYFVLRMYFGRGSKNDVTFCCPEYFLANST
jgi:hypothetical protein